MGEAFHFDVVPIDHFCFCFSCLRRYIYKMLLYPMSETSLPLLSASIFMVSGLTFRSLIHFEFIFVHGIRKWSSFILFHVAVQFFTYHLLKRLSFSHWIFLPPLLKINWPYNCGFISRFTILFYWSRCLFLCQYNSVLITTVL